jgi:molybdopterin molybdotransferase
MRLPAHARMANFTARRGSAAEESAVPSFEEARKTILDQVAALGAEIVPALEATGRVLASDGYAVRAADVKARAPLRVTGYVPAGGEEPGAIAPGAAARILTGAPLPPGADAVVPLEKAQERDGLVLLEGPVQVGANVRHRGEDLRGGEVVLGAGAVLGPGEISALASCSRLSVAVVRRARVAVLSSGDELVEPGEPLAPGKIYNSNSLAVAAAVRQVGGEPTILEIARDERGALAERIREGLRADALVTTAGVSMGDRDLVRVVLAELSVRPVFWKVDVKPGLPTAFALHGSTPIFSLPGNPVSTLLTFEEFVRPALLKMMGHRDVLRPVVKAVLQEDIAKKPGRVSLVRVRLERRDSGLLAWSAGDQATGRLKTTLRADGIAVIPAEWGPARAGATIDVQVLRGAFAA